MFEGYSNKFWAGITPPLGRQGDESPLWNVSTHRSKTTVNEWPDAIRMILVTTITDI